MEKECSRLLRILHLEMKKNFNKDMESLNLTAVQCQILLFLFHQDEMQEVNQRDIERMYGLSNPTVSGILKRLEEKELIVRKICKKDGRYKKIEVTEKATELKNQLHERGMAAEEKLVRGLSLEEQEEFIRILKIMTDNVRHAENSAADRSKVE